MRGYKILLGSLTVSTLVFNVFLYLNPNKETLFNYAFNVLYAFIYLLGAVVAYSGVKKYGLKSLLGKSLIFYAIGLSSYTAGQLIWAYYNLVLKIATPYPGLPDVFFILFSLFVAIGFIYLVRSIGGKITARLIFEFIILFIVLFSILISFLGTYISFDILSDPTNILNLAYPALDSFLVALAVTGVRTVMGTAYPYLLIFAFAPLLQAISDTVFSSRLAYGIYWNGDVSDTLFTVSGVLFTLGIIYILSSPPRLSTSNR